MSLAVKIPYTKPVSRKSLTMDSLSVRWKRLRKIAQAELSLAYPNVNLMPITSSQIVKSSL